MDISATSPTSKAAPSHEKILSKLLEEIKPRKASAFPSPARGGCWDGSAGKGEAWTSLARMSALSVGLSRGHGLLCHQLATARPPGSSAAGALSPFIGRAPRTALGVAEGPTERRRGGQGALQGFREQRVHA